jgi:hypothetical protein
MLRRGCGTHAGACLTSIDASSSASSAGASRGPKWPSSGCGTSVPAGSASATCGANAAGPAARGVRSPPPRAPRPATVRARCLPPPRRWRRHSGRHRGVALRRPALEPPAMSSPSAASAARRAVAWRSSSPPARRGLEGAAAGGVGHQVRRPGPPACAKRQDGQPEEPQAGKRPGRGRPRPARRTIEWRRENDRAAQRCRAPPRRRRPCRPRGWCPPACGRPRAQWRRGSGSGRRGARRRRPDPTVEAGGGEQHRRVGSVRTAEVVHGDLRRR